MGSGDVLVSALCGLLDTLRSKLIRVTTRSPLLRELFQCRARRLAALFALACMSSLALSALVPLWLLLLGPLVYGIPHIFASLRYFHPMVAGAVGPRPAPPGSEERRRAGLILVAALPLFAGIIAYRLLVNLNVANLNVAQLSEWTGSTYLELGGLAAAFIAGALIYRVGLRRTASGALLLAPLVAGFAISPIATVGALVMIHNFVGYGYWIRAAGNPEEKSVAWGGFAVALAVTCAILGGGMDGAFRHFQPTVALSFAGLSAQDMARLILPNLEGETLWLRLSCAFAFGQAMHYFVWLKAIPDQFHYHQVPTSFRQSLKLLERDFTRAGTVLILCLTAGSFALWSLLTFKMARLVYFAIASFHGYFEIAGLALAPKQSPQLKSAAAVVSPNV